MIRTIIICLFCFAFFSKISHGEQLILSDTYITAKAETAVLKAKLLDDESIPIVGIKAATNNGVVTLTGNVKNKSSIVSIIKHISYIKGVKKVISKLKVEQKV